MMKVNFESEKANIRRKKLAKARAEEKPYIYVSEELIRWKNIRYDLFLEVGNMGDIFNLSPKDAIGIIERSHERKPPEKGKLKVSRRTKYHDDVIRRGREEMAKSAKLEAIKKSSKGGKKWQNGELDKVMWSG